ncbi:unnamed protein product [Tetraodon nigroviridis]|uniref:(spotted green pufferfish) hypothetical protein n=1 Tax=Tetraodon nigroviridis TaxID=99883 RepID=Q4T324_TETNG|nr:unnamed protein product [Tetraodon nigroviridis]
MAECGEGKTEEEIKAVVITQEVLDSKAEQQEKMISNEETKVAAKSLRAASSSPKISPRRSGEGTPTKLLGDAAPLESAPQKRRPGRPKKLKPQLEQKVKRPIGRPRKQKDADSAAGVKKSDGNADKPSDAEETATKNLKITVVYGRSRRNKRTVSEGFDQLQTEFRDACQAAGLKSDLRILTHGSNANSVSVKSSIVEPPEMVHFISPLKEATTQSSSNIKCPKREDSAPIRKPGRPAKIKISGISVTVTTVSPRQRKIQMRKNTRQDPKTLVPAKMRSPELKAAKSSLAILSKSAGKNGILDAGTEAEDSGQDGVAVRHSARVRKPSIHFLHAVATSAYRSYSRSNALLRRSKQLLLNKVSNERKQAEHASSVEFRGERAFSCETGRQKIAEELGRVAGEKETALNSKLSSKLEGRKPRTPSVVRALFDCSPNKPRSCSMQQLCSWFMKTTETRSLAIVKKTSSRNPYEVMHFPRPGSSKSVCHSPQTERLRKHIKKFAKIVPKSPLEHRLMQRRARAAPRQSARGFKRKLFTAEGTEGKRGAKWRSKKVLSNYQATLRRARTRFSSRKDRQRQRSKEDVTDVCNRFVGRPALAPSPKHQALRISKHYRHLEDPCATGSAVKRGHPAEVPKEQNLCCKAWSPEKLKECRVFLRKINSPDSESAEEEWDSCTVTLDDGWPPADLVAGRRRELAEAVKAVKTKKRTRPSRALPRKRAGCAPGVAKEPNEIPTRGRKGKRKLPGDVAAEPPQPPPAKLLRQSRMRGLTGPRWCDFVFGN